MDKFTLATRGLGCSNASASRNCRVSRLTTAWDLRHRVAACSRELSSTFQPSGAQSKHLRNAISITDMMSIASITSFDIRASEVNPSLRWESYLSRIHL